MSSKRRKTLGLALGGGAARGFVHIGILKVLHKNNIKPNYLSGTSMGSIIGALYASGYSPLEIEEIAKTTDLREVIDFTIPKSGLIKGELMEWRIRRMLKSKQFSDLKIPLRVVSYDLKERRKVVFKKGDVAKAVRASSSIPGIFSPVSTNGHLYVDGVVGDPTPFDTVKDMGADIVMAVDLFLKEKKTKSTHLKENVLMHELKEKFIVDELFNLKNYVVPKRWPRFIRKVLSWLFDKILYPARFVRIATGFESTEIVKIMNNTIEALSNNLARERMKNANIDIAIEPKFHGLNHYQFDKVDEFIKIGENEMKKQIPNLKKKLGIS